MHGLYILWNRSILILAIQNLFKRLWSTDQFLSHFLLLSFLLYNFITFHKRALNKKMKQLTWQSQSDRCVWGMLDVRRQSMIHQ